MFFFLSQSLESKYPNFLSNQSLFYCLAISELTHGPFGAGPTINGRRVVGSPFTAIGPFAKISIKAMLFVQGIKTESKDGTVQTFGTFDEYDTFIVKYWKRAPLENDRMKLHTTKGSKP